MDGGNGVIGEVHMGEVLIVSEGDRGAVGRTVRISLTTHLHMERREGRGREGGGKRERRGRAGNERMQWREGRGRAKGTLCERCPSFRQHSILTGREWM